MTDKTDLKLDTARFRGLEAVVEEAHAIGAVYEKNSENLVVSLRGGALLIIPVHLLQGLAGAAPELIEKVQVTPRGNALQWEELDVDFLVQSLVAGSFGNEHWMQDLAKSGKLDAASLERQETLKLLRGMTAAAMGRKGGSASTKAKQDAARENGRKGGRPRKEMPTSN